MTVRAQDGEAHLAAPTRPYGPSGDVPDRLTLPATLVLVAVALGLAFGGAVMVGTGGSRAKPATARGPALVQRTPGSAFDPELPAAPALPALRVSREAKAQLKRSTGIARSPARPLTVVSAPVVPAGTARSAPTAAATPRVAAPPKPTPVPTPVPSPAATPVSSGDFDSTGEATSDVADPTRDGGNSTAGVTK